MSSSPWCICDIQHSVSEVNMEDKLLDKDKNLLEITDKPTVAYHFSDNSVHNEGSGYKV